MSQSTMSRRALLAGAALAATAPIRTAFAAYPTKPIKWIVAYAAGGGTDTLARVLGEAMTSGLGQSIVIDNRPGGATNIGAQAAATSAPDGHTIFTADNGTLVFNLALFKRLPYDPQRDFREVGLMARFPLVLAVKKTSVSTTVQDLISRARAEPGQITCASAGIGSPHHLAMERLAREAGIRFNHVPYRGAAPALNDLVGGSVECMIVDNPSAANHFRAGSIRPLAVCSPGRLDSLPDVPTVQEALGLKDFEASAWQGLVVPKATPDDIVQRLTAELAAALGKESVRERMRQMGFEALTGGPADMQSLIEKERSVWLPLIQSLGITLD